jgi:hypothetical protein
MFQLRVVLDQPKNWLDYVPAWVTAIAALLTVVVALFIAYKQGRLQKTLAENQSEIRKMQLTQQERQLRMDLYRRYKVYTDTGEFMRSVLSLPSAFVSGGDEHRRFGETMQNAEMLFRPEVFKYLQDIANTTMAIWGAYQRMAKDAGDNAAIEENSIQFQRLSDLWVARPGVFSHDLFLG